MKIIRDYAQYLKDNPKGYWFKRKLYGWGWTPARYQGWLVVFGYLIGVVYFASKLNEEMSLSEIKKDFFAPIILLTLILIFISYWKGEKPKWQWGKHVED